MRPGVKFRVDVDDERTRITGEAADMREHLNLRDMHYIESDGLIMATIYDPLPFAGCVKANRAVRMMRVGE